MREGAIKRDDPVDAVRVAAEPLPAIDDPAFADLFDRFGQARVVLLGEASHGTSEFYRARAAITRRLIERHGFTIVAAEADWPDAAAIDRIVRHKPPRGDEDSFFDRFPTWMWKNKEVLAFVGWLRDHNDAFPPDRRAGFYGLDLYNLNGSIRAVIDYLDRVDPEAARLARTRYGCIRPYSEDPAVYGRLALTEGFSRCEGAVVEMLTDLFAKSRDYGSVEDEDFLDAAANARLIADAEAYYRVMYTARPRAGICATATCIRRSICC
jgi:erythromycin esterase-like protein